MSGMKPFEEWKAEQQQQLADIRQKVRDGVKEVFSSDRYAQYLQAMSRFHTYSFRNTMLIFLQNPNATHVAGYDRWKSLGRNVNKGEKGIQILAPAKYTKVVEVTHDPDGKPLAKPEQREMTLTRFKPTYVFDLSQTSGRELSQPAHPWTDDHYEYKKLLAAAAKKIFPYQVQLRHSMPRRIDSRCDHESKTIFLREGISDMRTFQTLVHEISHMTMHPSKSVDKQQREFQADSVAYVVCRHFGIDGSQYSLGSFRYVAAWADAQKLDVLEQTLFEIEAGAQTLIHRLEQQLAVERVRAGQARQAGGRQPAPQQAASQQEMPQQETPQQPASRQTPSLDKRLKAAEQRRDKARAALPATDAPKAAKCGAKTKDKDVGLER